MYSEHGFDAVMRPDSGDVCQSLIVSSYWIPGSAQAQAASANLRNRSLAGTDRKSTRLNSSHVAISYAVFCLKKKTEDKARDHQASSTGQSRSTTVRSCSAIG